ncbi:MAG: hypothetical protein JWP44_4977 [Mucilaginibacter sp.]|nr:hypothetical protein [Mucilaginibacter sp.]
MIQVIQRALLTVAPKRSRSRSMSHNYCRWPPPWALALILFVTRCSSLRSSSQRLGLLSIRWRPRCGEFPVPKNNAFNDHADMMSGRVGKSPPKHSKKSKQRSQVAATIIEIGFDVMPCSFCHSRGMQCKMMDGVSCCSECVRRGWSCDSSGVSILSCMCLPISGVFSGNPRY